MSSLDEIGEPMLRLGIFAAVFAAMAVCELARPRRPLRAGRWLRWPTNLGMAATATVLVTLTGALAAPLVATGAAVLAARHGWGLLHMIDAPPAVAFVLALVVLDFAIWLQHVASHRIGMLWRLHRMHHADLDFDLTTGIRFHPVEILLSMLWKVACVLALGVPAAAVVAFEAILNACAVFNHANVRLPATLDAALRLLVVTPDMHRVHHSVEPREHHSNYGFNLSVWDRLFGTYTAQPGRGHDDMTIGLAPYQSADSTRFWWCLTLPWRKA